MVIMSKDYFLDINIFVFMKHVCWENETINLDLSFVI